ncbi:MAG: tripartite tricarboxylate transporter substrate binding protein [Polaromonas sp.]|nr:tripartite tricarboxylate transporter substrate binding protein [Polaromonas sp.]
MDKHEHGRTAAQKAAARAARRHAMVLSGGLMLGLLAASTATTATAQGFPAKPVRILSAYPPGISPDVTLRLLAEKLGKYWNQPVVVDARPGANGFLAISALKQSAPDGYTLLLLGNAHLAINPYLLKSMPYNVQTDFAPVSTVYQAPFFLGISTSGPYKNVRDIVNGAAANPGKVFYSTPYVGSPPHFGGAALAHLSNTKMVPVHYKDGPAIYTSVATNDVAFSIATIRSFAPMVDAGKMKVIAVAAPARLPAYPDIPTIEESGGPKGMEVTSWVGILAPVNTPPEVVQRISADMARALAEPDIRQRFQADGVVAASSTPPAMAELIRSDGKVYEKAIKLYGMQVE